MTQQNVNINENNTYKRKLFFDNGIRYIEVKAKHVNDYIPPTPSIKTQLNPVIFGTAGLVGQGISHYTMQETLLFYNKSDFAQWLQFIGTKHKYYDEKGSIFYGLVTGEPQIQTMEAQTKYMVTCSFILIKKQEEEYKHARYLDVNGHWAETYINEMQDRNLIKSFDDQGNEIQYFIPDEKSNRAEICEYLVNTYRYVESILRG